MSDEWKFNREFLHEIPKDRIASELSALAAQESNDGYDWDLVQLAADRLRQLENAIAPFVMLAEQSLKIDNRKARPLDTPVYQVNSAVITIADCLTLLDLQQIKD